MCTKEQTLLVPLGHVFGSACTGLQLAVIRCLADLNSVARRSEVQLQVLGTLTL